ncbi:MAG: DUF192 domain-containing protein [Actinomycetota bacterium]
MPTTTSVIGTSATTTTTVADQLAMFATTTVAISGEAWTVAVADTPALRAQGLMGVTDLGELDGMLFVFESNVSNGFWMKDTPIPLDIAFFDVDGVLVDLLTMTPCESDPCPTYSPAGEYRYAIETGVGRWDAVDQPELVLGD